MVYRANVELIYLSNIKIGCCEMIKRWCVDDWHNAKTPSKYALLLRRDCASDCAFPGTRTVPDGGRSSSVMGFVTVTRRNISTVSGRRC
jgi:hypothetical protein